MSVEVVDIFDVRTVGEFFFLLFFFNISEDTVCSSCTSTGLSLVVLCLNLVVALKAVLK